MSKLTKHILGGIDYRKAIEIRNKNFLFIHNTLKTKNKIEIDTNNLKGPMVYPFFNEKASELKQKFIDNNIFVATYWPNVLKWCKQKDFEYKLASRLIAIPIDQRYGLIEMENILKVIDNG